MQVNRLTPCGLAPKVVADSKNYFNPKDCPNIDCDYLKLTTFPRLYPEFY